MIAHTFPAVLCPFLGFDKPHPHHWPAARLLAMVQSHGFRVEHRQQEPLRLPVKWRAIVDPRTFVAVEMLLATAPCLAPPVPARTTSLHVGRADANKSTASAATTIVGVCVIVLALGLPRTTDPLRWPRPFKPSSRRPSRGRINKDLFSLLVQVLPLRRVSTPALLALPWSYARRAWP